ncbi:TetR family transcriptional regulator [Paenibacillus sp. KQZ6P-2]|uniref:TetR family transcriptional regulator n=1 Tax=Paenibacillus mangrovi TaxID=2931978 RepID=A0A9X2B457_9BACL|nr:TetR/AcrR family transcriptional regulator [Paenibacillus mangrovi]MCJ8014146.1 TetR family transcriptional regulator [Paenibacillus mangrovi]
MSLLKQRIMESAMRLFSEKGYASTSIQDIANDCGIAKPSLYKFFTSKEDLLIEVYGDRVQRMYEQAEAIKADDTLSPRDRFIRETLHQMQYFTDLKFNIEYHNLFVEETGKFIPFCHCLRSKQFNYYKDCILSAFGEQLEPYIWELVISYLGLMKEFTQLPVAVNHPIHLENAAIYIVDRMGDMSAGIVKNIFSQIVQPSIMSEYVRLGLEGKEIPFDKHRADVFENLLSSIKELPALNSRKEDLNEAAQLLKEEAAKEEPKRILIRALIEFLESQHELRNIVGQIQKLLL